MQGDKKFKRVLGENTKVTRRMTTLLRVQLIAALRQNLT